MNWKCPKFETDVIPEQCWFTYKSCADCVAEDKQHKEAVAKALAERKKQLKEQQEHIEFGY